MTDWYQQIEPEVRELVRSLRNQGFNTVCSCGHRMLIQIACDSEDLCRLWNTLYVITKDANSYEIHFYWHSWQRFAEVLFKMPDGSFNPNWRSGKDWAGYPYGGGKNE